MMFLARYRNTIFSSVVLKHFTLSKLFPVEEWCFTLSRLSIPDYDVLTNKFHRTFCNSRPIQLEAGVWNEEGNNKAVLLPYHALGATVDKVIHALSQLFQLRHQLFFNLHKKGVYAMLFLKEILLPTFIVRRRYVDPLKQIRRFECQCGVTVNNDTLLLKMLPLSLSGIAYNW